MSYKGRKALKTIVNHLDREVSPLRSICKQNGGGITKKDGEARVWRRYEGGDGAWPDGWRIRQKSRRYSQEPFIPPNVWPFFLTPLFLLSLQPAYLLLEQQQRDSAPKQGSIRVRRQLAPSQVQIKLRRICWHALSEEGRNKGRPKERGIKKEGGGNGGEKGGKKWRKGRLGKEKSSSKGKHVTASQ